MTDSIHASYKVNPNHLLNPISLTNPPFPSGAVLLSFVKALSPSYS